MSQEFVVANVWLLGVFVAESVLYQGFCLVMALGFFWMAASRRKRG